MACALRRGAHVVVADEFEDLAALVDEPRVDLGGEVEVVGASWAVGFSIRPALACRKGGA